MILGDAPADIVQAHVRDLGVIATLMLELSLEHEGGPSYHDVRADVLRNFK